MLRTAKLEAVQKAVETLIEAGWVRGKRDADAQAGSSLRLSR